VRQLIWFANSHSFYSDLILSTGRYSRDLCQHDIRLLLSDFQAVSHEIFSGLKGDTKHVEAMLPMTGPRLVTRFLPLALWAGALVYLSLAPAGTSPPRINLWDKFSHFAAYAVLAVLLVRFVAVWWPPLLRVLVISWLICFASGLLLEVLQWAMAMGRQFEIGDLLANGLGALGGCALFCRKAER